MRYFHKKGNLSFCPSINLAKLWTLLPEDVRKSHAKKTDVAPVLDVTKFVRRPLVLTRVLAAAPAYHALTGARFGMVCLLQGYFKVLGKGVLPNQPLIVKAKFFTKSAEVAIKEAGGACIMVA